MYVLGIETSCDETAAAVVRDGRDIRSSVVSSSIKFHKKYGGVVPEIASRMSLEAIAAVTDLSLSQARIKLKDVGLISVTSGPGLLGSLLVGVSFAKAISFCLDTPVLGINHIYAHIYSSILNRESIYLPFIALIVSGGHTSLFMVRAFDRIELLGSTQDDAAGEAFDKVAKILGLGYPGGPLIERLAKQGNPARIRFRCSGTKEPLNFSFSGIKTAVLYYVRQFASSPVRQLQNQQTKDIAASFQEAVVDTLVNKSLLACKAKRINRLVIGGGVAANSRLREKFFQAGKTNKIKVYFPSRELCMDNAAMVAGLGYRLFKKGCRSDLTLDTGIN
jgi:N6-L-threonylcarbamoyladenine synthase